ncbi:MAG: hypothetical protein Q9M20_04655 [Mariprofundaceae bacterium]|nr:hypothetical protein [Mariprofundaceae bacterium]
MALKKVIPASTSSATQLLLGIHDENRGYQWTSYFDKLSILFTELVEVWG